MNWLKKLKMNFFRTKFESSVLLCCSKLISELLEDENNETRDKIQKTIGNRCFDVIRKRGIQEINDFRKSMIEDVTKIVQSDNPIISMRKTLIRLIHSDTLNRSFIVEKYAERRQELYEEMNQFGDGFTDETASVIFILSEAECCIFRMLQQYYFEEVGKDDWFSRYSRVYEMYIESLFNLTLAQIDKEDISIMSITFPAMKKQVEHFQKELIGEIIDD